MDKGSKTFNGICLWMLIAVVLIAFTWTCLADSAKAWDECKPTDEYPYFVCEKADDLKPAPWAPERDRLEWDCLNPEPIDHRTSGAPSLPDACIKLAEWDAAASQNRNFSGTMPPRVLPTPTPVCTDDAHQGREFVWDADKGRCRTPHEISDEKTAWHNCTVQQEAWSKDWRKYCDIYAAKYNWSK